MKEEQQFDAETLRLAKLRRDSHGPGLRGFADEHSDPKGIAGELAVSRAFGFSMDGAVNQPEGDGGVDFAFCLAGRIVTIDVKTASTPTYMLVLTEKIRQVADIVILCRIDIYGFAYLVGWEYGITLAGAPVRNCGGGPSHFIPADRLRPVAELVQILSRREK